MDIRTASRKVLLLILLNEARITWLPRPTVREKRICEQTS